MKIMLVEDCPADQSLFAAMAKQVDPQIEVDVVSMLIKAVSEADHYDALFVDLTLDDATPAQVMEFIRRRRRRKPTVIVTADDSHTRIVEAGHLGVGYLLKGKFTPAQILIEIYRQAGQIQERIEIESMFEEMMSFLRKLETLDRKLDEEAGAGAGAGAGTTG